MRIIIAPDSFTGTLTAQQAAVAIHQGWTKSAPEAEFFLIPMSDGGPGFLDALNVENSGLIKQVRIKNLLGEEILSPLLFMQETCFIESAQVVGPQFLNKDARKPLSYSSFGIGQLIKFAAQTGAKKIVVGVGGTASIDAGLGLLAAIFESENLDLQNPPSWLKDVDLIAATDVTVPLFGPRGIIWGFGKQKGLDESEFESAEIFLKKKVNDLGRRHDGKDPSLILGSGAGGGIGYAVVALGGKQMSGIEIVLQTSNFEEKLSQADLLITGEGSLDWQTLTGKVIMGLAQKAQKFAVPTIALAGRVSAGKRELAAAGIVGAYGCVTDGELIPADPFGALSSLAERLGKTWSS